MYYKCTCGYKVRERVKMGLHQRVQQPVSIQMKWPFCTLKFCGWDPTLGDALDFHPFPTESPDTFQTPERDQLPAAPCQMTSYLCSYRTAAVLWILLTVGSQYVWRKWETASNCWFLPRLLWLYTTYFSHTRSQSVPIFYCIVCQLMCECESLLMRVLNCLLRFVSFCVCVAPPQAAENRFSLHLRCDNDCHLWL